MKQNETIILEEYEEENTVETMGAKTPEEREYIQSMTMEELLVSSRPYANLMMMYHCAIREITTKLQVLDDEFSTRNQRNPIASIQSRVKKPASILKKLRKYGLPIGEESIINGLHDVAGVRVICSFIDDIYMIADLLARQDDIRVLQIKDYIKNPKENGYRSYHMIVEIPVFFSTGKTPMKVEIQIRTIAMDFWASLEHQLRYKKGIENVEGYSEISEMLLQSACTIAETDERMQQIKDRIGSFHDLS